ncbi:MAG TPA: hypothetical protein VK531_02860 [Gemmatimonadales bacterium]|nr:hypothetical protein [Gemmatimonadales bacterium]
MGVKARYRNGMLEYFDPQQLHERVGQVAPVTFYDDFYGKAIDTTLTWTAIDVSAAGLTTPVLVADSATVGGNGIVSLPLDATSEAQETGLTWGDQRTLALNRGPIFDCVLSLQTLPTLLAIGVWGLAGDKNAVADNVAESAWFRVDGNGVVTVETDDTVTETVKVSTGVTVVAGAPHAYRIDCTDPTKVLFYIDGVQVAASTTFNMNQVPALKLQPYFHLAKASGAGLGVIELDVVRAFQKRS